MTNTQTGSYGQKYWGTNIAALGWGGAALPGVAGQNYPLITTFEVDYFSARGMNTIRVSILWERVQPALFGALDTLYLSYIVRPPASIHCSHVRSSISLSLTRWDRRTA
jgi:endoglucanase